jgi:membrane associated rhomboid family serine protease
MAGSFRARGYGFDWRSFITPGVKLLVLTCAGVFLLQTLLELLAPPYVTLWLIKWFALIPAAITSMLPPRIWQLFTYIFLHADIWHLLFNMLFLWMFGRELELVWGKRRFLN